MNFPLHITHRTLHRAPSSERGIALLIVISLLTVVGVMGVAFAFSMYLETQATRQFVSTTQARYVAEAGVSYARALLDEDALGSRVDDLAETWLTAHQGGDVDVDEDGELDAQWQLVTDSRQETVGRYAVKVTDESGKVNLNAAQAAPSPLALGAWNLTTLLEAGGVANAAAAAQAIEAYRYGPDAKPGVGGVDDDSDGSIDEVDEYQPLALIGDDRQIQSLEEIASIITLRDDELREISRWATVYSWDLNVAIAGIARVNANTATATELLTVLLDAGVEDPWQGAVNMADFVDSDFEMSIVTKSSTLYLIPNQGDLGAWTWTNEPENHYGSDELDGAVLSWLIAVPSGSYRVRALGLSGTRIGDMTVDGELTTSVDPGESLGIFELSGSLTVTVANRETAGTPCAFRGIELISETSQAGGVVVRGIEAIRFNELMIDPSMTFGASSATFDAKGSDWVCTGTCSNSGVGQARWSWTSLLLPQGRYYVQVFGTQAGDTVGNVSLGAGTTLLAHGGIHSSTVAVGSDGKFTVTIGKTASEGTYYLKELILSPQPDAEYVELINLSDEAVDVSGWTIEGELTGGRQAELPSGSIIAAHGLLVAAVDLDDGQSTLAGNDVSARSAWGIDSGANAVELTFPGGAPTAADDWLKVTVPGSVSRLQLRRGGVTVDEVEYALPPQTTADFQSLEKGDPTVTVDQDLDGVDEGWFPSLQLYTPGLTNDNNGIQELVDLEVVLHDPATESSVLNRPLGGVGELAGMSSGTAWKPFSSTDLSRIVDRLTVEGVRLEAEGQLVAGQSAWAEKADGSYEYNSTAEPATTGSWRWTKIPDGPYRLSLYGWAGEEMSVRWEQGSGGTTDWSPGLLTNAQGRIVIGQITIGTSVVQGETGTLSNTLTLDVSCSSTSSICHVDYVRLDPNLIRIGPVNVNTAPLEALMALPGMTNALASRIIAGRPYGDQGEKGRGIGDLLIGETLASDEEGKLEVFRQIAHLLTTRSDVYEIQSLGQSMNGNRVEGAQRIFAVVQR